MINKRKYNAMSIHEFIDNVVQPNNPENKQIMIIEQDEGILKLYSPQKELLAKGTLDSKYILSYGNKIENGLLQLCTAVLVIV